MSIPMVPNNIFKNMPVTLTPGQSICVQILNANGTVASTLLDDATPEGKTFSGTLSYNGQAS